MRSYLVITIHDNDFTAHGRNLGELIYKTFQDEGSFPKQEDLDRIKPRLAQLWGAYHDFYMVARSESYKYTNSAEYIARHLKISIMTEDEICCDNYELIFIPLYETGEAFVA